MSERFYSKKSNAKRAALAVHSDLEAVRFLQTAEGWTWELAASDSPAEAAEAEAAVADQASSAAPAEESIADVAAADVDAGAAAPAVAGAPHRGRAAWAREGTANAAKGILPPAPDFSAATHARFRGKLAQLVALAEAGDIAGLQAVAINPISSSPKALARYRDLCVAALEAALRRFEAA